MIFHELLIAVLFVNYLDQVLLFSIAKTKDKRNGEVAWSNKRDKDPTGYDECTGNTVFKSIQPQEAKVLLVFLITFMVFIHSFVPIS